MSSRLPILFLSLLTSSFCFAATVKTLDGKTHEGEIKFDPTGHLVITPTTPATTTPAPDPAPDLIKLDLANILTASFKDPTLLSRPAPPPRTDGDRLPPPWVAINVGSVINEPYARYRGESGYSIRCQGGDIGARNDSFVFVQQPAAADADLVCRFDDVAHPTRVAAGLMFRDGSDSDAPYVAIVHAAGHLKFLRRPKRGGGTDGGTVQPRTSLPVWLRLVRRSNSFTAYSSDDAKDWSQLATESVTMGPTALAGIVVCTRENTPLGTHAHGLRLATAQSALASSASAGAAAIPTNLPEGLMLRSGTVLAAATITKADDGAIRFSHPSARPPADRRDVNLTTLHVARLIFRDLTPDMVARIPAGAAKTGVLLKSGDFVEGEFKGILSGRVHLSSVLFGVQRFEVATQAACVVLSDLDPAAAAKAQYVVRAADGSTYMAASATIQNGALIVEDPAAPGLTFTLERGEIDQITAGPGKLQPLASLKPARIDAPPGTTPAEACVIATPSAATLAGQPPANPILLRAASSASWDLNKEYRLLTFKAGLPDATPPTAPVRFIVLADNQPLYKSPPRTSLDPPLAASLSLKNVQTLTLKVEPTTADPPGGTSIPIAAIWSDASLVK